MKLKITIFGGQMSQNKSSVSFAEGNINRLMLKFSLPCIMSLLVSSFYNIVDQMFIGNSELSTLGNAATGVVFPVFIIAQAFAWCFGDGCAAYLNICQGQNNDQDAQNAVGGSITISFLLSLILIAVICPIKTPMLLLFGASENTLAYAAEYLNIILITLPLFVLSNALNSVIRADGSPTWAMAAILIGALTNTVLDPLFIFGFKMGMAGAAIATAIGQGASFLATAVYFFRAKTFRLSLGSFVPQWRSLKRILKLGISTFITQGAIVLVAVLSNVQFARLGECSVYGADVPIAVIGIQSKLCTIVLNLTVGLALGCQPIISFNTGAGYYKRVRELF
jgi:putative MATE family efflux protein